MIEIEDIYKGFKNQQVLKGVSLTVKDGHNLIILGRSGTGKSVLLKLIIGLLKPERGSIKVFDKDITKISHDELNTLRKKMGFLFQDAALYDSMTILENVIFPLQRHTDLSYSEMRDKAIDRLSRVGLKNFAEKLPAELSGGMRKRAGLARALILDPQILLYDEPTSGLDPITSREIDDLILQMKEETGVTSLTVTHELVSARNIGDEMAVLHEGRVIAYGSYESLQDNDNEFVRRYMHDAFAKVARA